MATAKPKLTARLGKSTLSMYLRTNCDRELYFSLFKSNRQANLIANGMPAPLSARPNIELVTSAGEEFEAHELEMLLSEMGASAVHCNRPKPGNFNEVNLATALRAVKVPSFILQPGLDPAPFAGELLTRDFGLSAAEAKDVPELSGLRPDVVIVRPRGDLQWEVMPSGKRRLLSVSDDRAALSVVDVKNTLEGNKSYAAEVVVYSIFLAKWLETSAFSDRFFVSDECFLWTHNEKSALAGLPATATLPVKIEAVISTLEKVEFAVVAPSVVKFFKEDIPRVMGIGELFGWQSTDYHVGPKCSNCDWLGFDRWLSTSDKAIFNANQDWYCRPSAASCDHLSQIPNVSRGARQVLEGHGVKTVSALSTLATNSPVLSGHSLLKRERSQLAPKAQAILTNKATTDLSAALAGLAKDVQLEVAIAVNFDSAAGLLTGIAARATLFMPFGSTPPIQHLADFAAPVENQTSASEWDVLFAFLSMLEQVVPGAERHLGGTAPKTQLYFWEHRQFLELCAAVGRHLPKIFGPARRGTKGNLIQALAWLFPPEELIERDGAVSPHIVFIGDIAQRVLRVPTPHAFTLLSVHEHYNLPSLPPRRMDSYFVDPMGNGIPRERIFEVWKNSGTIRRGGTVVTKAQAQSDYMKALKAHTHAIASIAGRLRQDFKANLKGTVKQLNPKNFTGARGVAFDSKLWIQWSDIEVATAQAERKVEFTLPAERLEASYKALVLASRISSVTPERFVYQVSPESREAKLDESGEYFVVASVANPGLPLETPRSLGLSASPRYIKPKWGGGTVNTYMMPLYSLVRGRIHRFDRDNLEAEVEFLPRSGYFTDVVADLLAGGYLPLGGGLFLMDGMPYDDSGTTTSILRAIGEPRSATADAKAVKAMGQNAAPAKVGSDADVPVARVLWTGSAMATTRVRTPASARNLALRAKALVGGRLDPSQESAIEGLSLQQLALVWGPPGTGKTSTLSAYLLAVVEESIATGRPRKILLTGPNYRAVEVLVHKFLEWLNCHPALTCHLYMVYSKSRPVLPLPQPPQPHLLADAVSLGDTAAKFALQSSYASSAVGVYAISGHTVPALVKALTGDSGDLVEAFDLVVVDESSQVPVTLALRPLASLKTDAELVIAGDPKQMPPIQSLPPPVGAEHLVGSIHTYLTERFGIPQQKLLVNYRSADHLVEFARTLGYDPKLSPFEAARRIRLVTAPSSVGLPPGLPVSTAWAALLQPERVVTTLLHDDPRSSQANQREAKMVASLAFLLRHCAASELAPNANPSSHFTDDDFIREGLGVVTPHKAQRALVLSELARLFPKISRDLLQESVDTVERFQGGERHTIIVSFGVGDVDVIEGEEEFLLQMERANVAISRAMAKCIVIMPKSLAYHLPNDNKVAQTAGALKSYVEEFCQQRETHRLGEETLEVRWH
ncbi:Superfamily I DNA/RNA helicase [Cupriavidus taiwanensis]|uniref:DEAD/DEAH box helicase n=1 Tax=Cupriavidus taiwanensis TaxID=164546 RepID=UPI000E1B3668|nr:ATP-binding protein [Cupriavidus taiwanensis]SPA10668.1 Superfamily I DNA/RNA helicase [Cupriavidus taiwanensis]